MPGQLFNLGRYFKKPKEEPSQAPVGEVPATSSAVSQTVTQTQAGPVSYSGIGPTPGGGQPYSGIGPPPTPPAPPPAQPPTPAVSSIDIGKRKGMDILTRLTQRSTATLMAGVQKAKENKNPYVDTEHVLWGLLSDAQIFRLISELKVTPSQIQQELEKNFKKGDFEGQPQFAPRTKKVLELSLSAARALGFEFISPEHILLALAQEGEGQAAQVLAKFGLNVATLNQKITGKKEGVKEEEKGKGAAIEQYCEDLTQKAREGKLDPVVGRSAEIERVIHILSRRTKNNPCLIGDAGVGKTAIVEGLAQKIVKGDVPESLLGKRILSLDLMSLVAGSSHRGEFEERLKNLIKEIKTQAGQIILFIDEIQNIVGAGAGGEGTMDASNILKPSLARGELQTIGTTTITEYRRYIEKDPALERRFQPVYIAEPTADQAIEMLYALRDKYEAFHRVKITDEAIEAAVRLSQRYIGDRFLPDKAVDLIDEAGSAVRLPAISLPEEIKGFQERLVRLENEKKEAQQLGDAVRLTTLEKEIEEDQKKLEELKTAYEVKKSTTTNEVTPEIIAEIISHWANIPLAKLTQTESEKLLNLEDTIHQRLIDQEEAVSAIAEAVRRGRAGLKSQKRPIGSFIFMGPTGVGKTELAKTLAEVLFGSEEMMVRLDMSEFMEKHEVAKLIGAPPGYVGYEEGGQLTEAIRRHPYAVVLLDEIEKAHPDVFNILIQILDDGRLTDNKGRTISFKNTIVICTSNIGTGLIQRSMLEVGDFSFLTCPLSTYAITPSGREVITRQGNFWAKNKDETAWVSGTLKEYFAGCTLKPKTEEFPLAGFETHAFTPRGEEVITVGEKFWQRTSPVAKEWETGTLSEMFADHFVSNASPDRPEEQLPVLKFSTNAFSPQEKQIITLNDRFWQRENLQSQEWQTGTLREYFGESKVKGEAKLPLEGFSVHQFLPQGEEIIINDNLFWKKGKEEWQNGQLAALFPKEKEKGEKGKKQTPKEELPFLAEEEKQEVQKQKEEEKFSQLANRLLEELRKFFRPELLNRFDEIIIFRPLTARHMLEIVELQFKQMAHLLEEQNVGLLVSEIAREAIAREGFDPLFGARPLRRVIQRYVENPISSLVIKEEIKSGDIVLVDFEENEFTFKVHRPVISPPPPPPAVEKEIPEIQPTTELPPVSSEEQLPPPTLSQEPPQTPPLAASFTSPSSPSALEPTTSTPEITPAEGSATPAAATEPPQS